MCGRLACTLCKEDIQGATCRYSSNGKNPPKWIEKYSWQNYQPGYNIAPSKVTPVLVKEEKVLRNDSSSDDIVLFPMRWGLIPNWYRGSLEEFSLKTNNCRSESILEKPTFRGPLYTGKRCVIVADGFYEWQSVKGKKQPYFIHFPQKSTSVWSTECDKSSYWTNEKEWNGPRLLTMAGLFDTWHSSEFGDIYSYSVITMDSSTAVSFIHDRMPAILDGDEQVAMWLDTHNVSFKEALSKLEAVQKLETYPVSTEVNNSRNDSINCILPITTGAIKSTPTALKRTALTSWLKLGKEQQSVSSPKQAKSD